MIAYLFLSPRSAYPTVIGIFERQMMKVLEQNQLAQVPCGEVGATKMGDDYSYTGERSFGECYWDNVNNGKSPFDVSMIIGCFF